MLGIFTTEPKDRCPSVCPLSSHNPLHQAADLSNTHCLVTLFTLSSSQADCEAGDYRKQTTLYRLFASYLSSPNLSDSNLKFAHTKLSCIILASLLFWRLSIFSNSLVVAIRQTPTASSGCQSCLDSRLELQISLQTIRFRSSVEAQEVH